MKLLNKLESISNNFYPRNFEYAFGLSHLKLRFIDQETETHTYVEQIRYLSQHEVTTVYVDFGHLTNHNEILAQTIALQYYRYLNFFVKY